MYKWLRSTELVIYGDVFSQLISYMPLHYYTRQEAMGIGHSQCLTLWMQSPKKQTEVSLQNWILMSIYIVNCESIIASEDS